MIDYIGTDENYENVTVTYFASGKRGMFYITKEYIGGMENPLFCNVFVNPTEDAGLSESKILKEYAEFIGANEHISGIYFSNLYYDNDVMNVTIESDDGDVEAVFQAFCDYFGEE